MASQNDEAEREMTVHQRGLVDTCFEEGQYESGIDILDQLRSPRYKPHGSHIRQLVYMALYPPPELDMLDAENGAADSGVPNQLLSQHQKSSLIPSPAASQAALNLLVAFAHTNSPNALMSDMPHYLETADSVTESGTGIQEEEIDDSYLARQSMRIKNARDCWAILKPGFINRQIAPPSTPKPKGRGRRKRVDVESVQEIYVDNSLEPLAEYAWPVLNWLLVPMEKDEEISARKNQLVPYSPLLLAQIPPSRTDAQARWDVGIPLDIAFYALQQAETKRRTMGVRLLTLLVNLSATTHIDLPMFLSAVSVRVSSLSSDAIASLFAALPPSRLMLQFKIALCKNYLSHSDSAPVSSPRKPQLRTQLRPAPVSRRPPTGPASGEGLQGSGSALEAAAAAPIAREYTTVSPSEVLDLIKGPLLTESNAGAAALRIRFELAMAYWALQLQDAQEGKDPGEWRSAVGNGRLTAAFESACASIPTGVDDTAIRSMKQLVLMAECA